MHGGGRLFGRIGVALAATVALLIGAAGAAAAATAKPAGPSPMVVSKFTVVVQTHIVDWAATDAAVHIKVYGCDNTSSPYVNLANGGDPFEIGSLDWFSPFYWNLNGICQIALVKYAGSDWQMSYTSILDEITGRVYTCTAVNTEHGYFAKGKQPAKYFGCA